MSTHARLRFELWRALVTVVGRPLRRALRLLPYDDPVKMGLLEIGRYSYGHPRVVAYPGDNGKVVFGSFVTTAADVEVFVGGNHRTDWVAAFPFRIKLDLPGAFDDGVPASKGPVVVGHDVWIARGAKLLSGVRVGNGAVIAAYAVVTRDVRPYAVVAGNPAREVRRRFTDHQVDALERIAWWNWPIQEIVAAVPLLNSPDIEQFVARFSLPPARNQRPLIDGTNPGVPRGPVDGPRGRAPSPDGQHDVTR